MIDVGSWKECILLPGKFVEGITEIMNWIDYFETLKLVEAKLRCNGIQIFMWKVKFSVLEFMCTNVTIH